MSSWVTATGFTFTEGNKSVYEAALDRIREMYSLVDTVTVSFSGGKDSTCVLMLALQVARELNRLPLEVFMIDEEVIDPDTIAYCQEVREWPEINYHWFCIPIVHTLRSQTRSHWITWDPAFKDVWARPMPPYAISSFPGMVETGGTIPEQMDIYFKQFKSGKIGELTGIRIQESMNRRRTIMQTGRWVTKKLNMLMGKPIYDWSWQDVWKAISDNKWSHSHFYDRMWMVGQSPHRQRVAPWGNVAASREAKYYAEFYPDFWEKAMRRLPELSAQARYGNTKLFQRSRSKPDGLTWQEYAFQLISEFKEEEVRDFWYHEINGYLRRWAGNFSMPFPEESPIIDGKPYPVSWKKVCAAIQKNDLIRTDGGGLNSRDRVT